MGPKSKRSHIFLKNDMVKTFNRTLTVFSFGFFFIFYGGCVLADRFPPFSRVAFIVIQRTLHNTVTKSQQKPEDKLHSPWSPQ